MLSSTLSAHLNHAGSTSNITPPLANRHASRPTKKPPPHIDSATLATLTSATMFPHHLNSSIANRNITSTKHHHDNSRPSSTLGNFLLPNATSVIDTLPHTTVSSSGVPINRTKVATATLTPKSMDTEEKQYVYTAILITFYATVVLGALVVAVWREKRQEIIVGNWDEYMKVRNVLRRILCLQPLRERREHDSVRSAHLLDQSETSMDLVIHQDV